MDNYELFGYEL